MLLGQWGGECALPVTPAVGEARAAPGAAPGAPWAPCSRSCSSGDGAVLPWLPCAAASPRSRQLESSAGENTISIIGTVRLYQPSWQPGSIFCLNPHRGQIVSSCSLPRISWERAEGHILQMLPHRASAARTPLRGQWQCTGPTCQGLPHTLHIHGLSEGIFLFGISRQGSRTSTFRFFFGFFFKTRQLSREFKELEHLIYSGFQWDII